MNKSNLKTCAKNVSANTSETLKKCAAALANELILILLKSNPKNNYSYKHDIYTTVSALSSSDHKLYTLTLRSHTNRATMTTNKTGKIATSKLLRRCKRRLNI